MTAAPGRSCARRGGPATARGTVYLEIEAKAFLRHMVRTLVGTMVEIGPRQAGAWGHGGLLEGARREGAGPTAPAHGLVPLGCQVCSRPSCAGRPPPVPRANSPQVCSSPGDRPGWRRQESGPGPMSWRSRPRARSPCSDAETSRAIFRGNGPPARRLRRTANSRWRTAIVESVG